MTSEAKKQIPITDGMMILPDPEGGTGQILGSKCRNCEELFFVKRKICENCNGDDLETIQLSNKGKLYAFSVMYYPAPAPYQPADPFIPYGVGWIELPEGLVLYSLLTENDPDKLEVGMEMELSIECFHQDQNGNDVMVTKFRPVKGA